MQFEEEQLEKCTTHGWVKRVLHQAGDQIKATCPTCGQFIKFVPKNTITEDEVINKSTPLF
jgi:predicted RNA-binding Zn-ribbon protein involved in translation (DUF1610 family)